MQKSFLVAPGPTAVPERARLAMAESLIHHRGPAFTEIFAEVQKDLQWVFQTEHEVLVLTSSGTGGFESAIRTFTKQNDTLIAIGGGKFGERWSAVARSYGLHVVDVDVQWGETVDLQRLEDALDAHPHAAMVTFCASETSTGVLQPTREIAELVHAKSNALVATDGITAIGVHDIPMDNWGLDVVVSGSQKAFSIPPGLSFVAAGPRAWERAKTTDHPGYYFDLRTERKKQGGAQTAYTPAISLVIGLREVLRMMREEGLENVFARHAMLSRATISAVSALGLTPFAATPSHAVTAARVPEGVSAPDVVKFMRDHGVTIAGGQNDLKPFLIRIGHLGYSAAPDILIGIGALEKALVAQGVDVALGSGLAAAQRELTW